MALCSTLAVYAAHRCGAIHGVLHGYSSSFPDYILILVVP
ncbi:hypothetical protein Runsl_2558 [Runella slithyformis DSM 19594]|uniref:Uncharacterized protein n=1 Tax=Runella slithyformis (strain ATCC 29530 / DSM 19594 / LMG 11500 / NCIMB 11436 / LSU 4) TaxID=761193 RepID=A0A7U4E692_RUNSL|nr:hypothetical protein Runsl_2558 [Runella slithyformis DSM 19594]